MPFHAIPESRHDAAQRALREAFGKCVPADPALLSGGVSGALIIRFQVRGRPYVLRVEPERIAIENRRRGFACMAIAAGQGVAPRVYYADAAAGVAIMDFVSSRPLSDHPAGEAGLVRELGALIAALQCGPEFPGCAGYPAMIESLLSSLSTSPFMRSDELQPCADGLALIRSGISWDSAALVASHNDPNSRNILFDGARVWLVDWELGFQNDPLVDLAILTHELAATPDLETILLKAALGVPPSRRVRARLHVVRVLARLFYGCIVLDSLRGAEHLAASGANVPFKPTTFRRAIQEGRLASGAPATAYAFARMSIAAFIDGVCAPEFRDCLSRAQ
ncbi:MAG: phosphotransferase [Bradyrhizobium sp.]